MERLHLGVLDSVLGELVMVLAEQDQVLVELDLVELDLVMVFLELDLVLVELDLVELDMVLLGLDMVLVQLDLMVMDLLEPLCRFPTELLCQLMCQLWWLPEQTTSLLLLPQGFDEILLQSFHSPILSNPMC